MSLTSISKGKQNNDFNAPSTIKIKILLQLFLVFLYFHGNTYFGVNHGTLEGAVNNLLGTRQESHK